MGGGAVGGLAALFGLLLLLALCNPMLLAFLVPVSLLNVSGEPVYVTCGGRWENGRSGRLPLYYNRFPPAIPKWRGETDMEIGAGRTRQIIYDWDDINFDWIVVRGRTRPYRLLKTDLAAKTACCWSPGKSAYEIPPLAKLPKADPRLLVALGLATNRQPLVGGR